VTADQLTTLLAGRVMGWTAASGRFLTGSLHWIPRWRFQPIESLMGAFRLLEADGTSTHRAIRVSVVGIARSVEDALAILDGFFPDSEQEVRS
jgi:hypothetical protein